MKKRLDVLLVERGLAESRSQAQALVMAGLVHGFDKPGAQVDEHADLTLDRPARFVSRGGVKLANALDVGYGQLHPRVRDDARVTVIERTNVRELTGLPFAPELVVCDVSFISVRTALPPALALAAPGWEALVLVKPQFEAGRSEVAKGVVRDPEVQRRVVAMVIAAARAWDAVTVGVVDSGLPGPKGNREFFIHLVNRPGRANPDDIDRWIADAIASA